MLVPGADLAKVEQDLAKFKCSRESEIDDFLKKNAIPYEKAHKSRTYLVVKKRSAARKELDIMAYFSIAISRMEISDKVSKTKLRALNGMGEERDVPCYLIGQLGKNDEFADEIDGTRLIGYALNLLKNGHERIGGRFVRVDCRDIPGLCRFYERNGFVSYQKDLESDLLQLVRYF